MSNNSGDSQELLQSFLDYLEFEKRSSKHTISSYSLDLQGFLSFIDTIRINECTDKDIRNWIVYLSEQDLSPRTINRKITAVRSFFYFLQRIYAISYNPVQKIRSLKTKKRLPFFVEKKSMNTLLDSIDFGEGFIAMRDKLIIELLYATGMRRSELLNLHVFSIDFVMKTIKIHGKRNKERIIPVLSETMQHVADYIEERNKIAEGHSFLLITGKGKPAYENLVYRVVKKYIAQISTIEKKSPHVLRHTFATHLLNEGADLNDIKELLGHASLSATQIYTHNSFEKLKDIYKQSHPRN